MSLPTDSSSRTVYRRAGAGVLVVAVLTTICCRLETMADYYYVSTNGSDLNCGTNLGAPFRTVQKAVDAAGAGDTILIREGVYREYVVPPRGGSSVGRLEISGYGNERPVLKGSDFVTDWTHFSNGIWKVDNWVINSQQVFEDGLPLRQVGWPNDILEEASARYAPEMLSLDDMTNGTFYYDSSNLSLYVWLTGGDAPSNHALEVSTRLQLLNGGYTAGASNEFFRVSGVEFMHCNTVAHSPYGWAGVVLGRNSIIEDCRMTWCDFSGYSVAEGSVVSNCEMSCNGMQGIGSASTNFLITDSCSFSNNYRGFSEYSDAAGFKAINSHATAGGTIENCEVAWNYGFGVWFDSCTGGAPIVVRNNYIHHNGPFPGHTNRYPAAVMMEIVKGASVYNNLIVSNWGNGCWIAASDNVRFCNNTLVGNAGYTDIRVADLPRRMPDGNWASLVSNEVVNNIISDSDCQFTLTLPADSTNASTYAAGNVSDHNCFHSSKGRYVFAVAGVTSVASVAEWRDCTGWDSNSIVDDPVFAGGGSYALAEGSPVVDSGADVSEVLLDYDGVRRPLDGDTNGVAGFDIGAYEFVHPAADTDDDGLVDTGEVARGTSPVDPDTDEDGMNDGDETKAGTDPLDSGSLLRLLSAERSGNPDLFVVNWASVTDVSYAVDAATNVNQDFFRLTGGIVGIPPENSYTDSIGGVTQRFYRVKVEP